MSVEDHPILGPDVFRGRFGSWEAAIKAAGLEVSDHAKRYTDEECFENLLAVWTHYGRPPKNREMKLPPSVVGRKAYIVRFGTWNKALRAFVERMNADTQDSLPKEAVVKLAKEIVRARVAPAEQRDIRLGLRFKILQRDHFKCVLCGDSPATNHAGPINDQADYVMNPDSGPFHNGAPPAHARHIYKVPVSSCWHGSNAKRDGSACKGHFDEAAAA